MDYLSFRIQNFKGISDQNIRLDKAPHGRTFALVGLNESGKTTILEAISLLETREEHPESLYRENFQHIDANDMVPMKQKANFNGSINISTTVSLTRLEVNEIVQFSRSQLSFEIDRSSIGDSITLTKELHFKNSIYQATKDIWSLSPSGKARTGRIYRKLIEFDKPKWIKLVHEVRRKMPPILYFPTFLFEFPQQIYLIENSNESPTNAYYRLIVQDILDSIDDGLTIEQHIVERARDDTPSARGALEAVLLKMGTAVSRTIFVAWNNMFGKDIQKREIVVRCYSEHAQSDEDAPLVYLEFAIKEGEAMYPIAERSLGFRWFFCFMLFTQFRQYRSERGNVLFLFDEPASNLHSRAQQQLLRSFDTITKEGRGKIIYSTHSHHMINPRWLEGTFIVSNESAYENEESMYSYSSYDTNVEIRPYRQFVSDYPGKTTYFQPILNTLDYYPSAMELIDNAIFVEGKNDFYVIRYFEDVILQRAEKLAILPGTTASGFDTLIALYLGWGRRFVLLLDDDEEGRRQKQRYIEEWNLPGSQAITLGEISPSWIGLEMEGLLGERDRRHIRNAFYPNKRGRLSKKEIARALQEKLILGDATGISKRTASKFRNLIVALGKQLSNYDK